LWALARRNEQTDRYPGTPTACTRRPCSCDRPRSRHALLMNAGRSSDSQTQPTACLLAIRTASPRGSQWPDNSRPLSPLGPRWGLIVENRLDTAAGPSRNCTGVPCLPVVHRSKRPATRFDSGVYRSCHHCQAVPITPPQAAHLHRPHLSARNLAGCAEKPPESVAVLRPCAAQTARALRTAFLAHNTPQVVC
jgi:hypothetical protein